MVASGFGDLGQCECRDLFLGLLEAEGAVENLSELVGGEKVCVSDIANVCPVEEVRVVADLEVRLVAFVDVAQASHDLPITWPAERLGRKVYTRIEDIPEDTSCKVKDKESHRTHFSLDLSRDHHLR